MLIGTVSVRLLTQTDWDSIIMTENIDDALATAIYVNYESIYTQMFSAK